MPRPHITQRVIASSSIGQFEPIQFHPTLLLDSSTFLTDGSLKDGADEVSRWNSNPANNNHATQGTGVNQPTWTANQQNGKAGINFISNDWLAANDVASVGLGDRTIFIVTKPVANPSVGVMTAFQRSPDIFDGNQSKLEITATGTITHTQGVAPMVVDSNDWTDTPFILTTTFSGTVGTARINGAPTTNPSFVVNELAFSGVFSIGQEFDGSTASNFYQGDMFQIIIYPFILFPVQVTLVEGYLSNRWAI